MTRDTVIQILAEGDLISVDQLKEVHVKGDVQRVRLLKQKDKDGPRRRSRETKAVDEVSPAELIASFGFEIPGRDREMLSEDRVMEAVAKSVGLPYLKIDPLKLDPSLVTSLVPKAFAFKHAVVPIRVENEALTVALSDPDDREVLDLLGRTTRYKIQPVLSSRSDIRKIITEFYGFRSSVNAAEKELVPQIDLGNLEQYVKLRSADELESTDRHVVKAVEYMLQYAYDNRASDIHVEPKREHSIVRFRIDGILHDVHRLPKAVHPAVAARIKTLARMDIAEKRRPQDGRIKTDSMGKEVELRVSTLPVAFGEKIVIRIFDPMVLMQDLESLGFFARDYQVFKSFLAKPHGLILVTGPTGSGKTTTLYSALKVLATPEINVTTIEDPIEMINEGFNQIAIQPHVGITFASSLRTILRQDPDVIMVGEIRDLETAEQAIQAALTGHLVFSTLHTNDAVSTIWRLLDLGVPSYLIGATLVGVVAQRLVRTICSHCKEEAALKPDELRALGMVAAAGSINVKYGRGCPRCRGTGYLGRSAIFEILDVTDSIRASIAERAEPGRLQKAAVASGMTSLRDCAVRQMLQGRTSFDEVLWITNGDS